MQKSKLGLNVGVVGAAAYLLSLFAGYIPTALLVGFVLLFEENNWLRRTAVKAAVLTFLFSIGYTLIGLLPEVIGVIGSIVYIFGGSFHISFISNLCSALSNVLGLVETVLLLALSLKATKQSTIVVGFVDQIVNKCME